MAHTHFALRVVMIILALLWIGNARIEWPTASAAAQTTFSDLRNGWYGNLPPVSRELAEDRIACIDRGLRQAGSGELVSTELYAEPLANVGGPGPAFAPTVVRWRWKSGATWTNDATLTALYPSVAYVEAARVVGVTPDRLFSCPDTSNAPVLVTLKRSPIGPVRDCPGGSRGPCYQAWGDAEDPLREGAVYAEPDGRQLVKKKGRFWVIAYHYWEVL